MPVPSRLANDGWWLCDSPPIAPIPIPLRITQRGYATMTNLAQPESIARPVRINVAYLRLAAAIGLAALADWLFCDEHAGLSVVIFAMALAGVSLATNLESVDRRRLLPAGVILVAGIVPAVENLDALSLG